MNNRLTRILHRWLDEHPLFKLSVLLAAATMDGDDETELLVPVEGAAGARLPLTIYNDVDDDCLFPRINPPKVPAVCVVADLPSPSKLRFGKGQVDYPGVAVAISYVERGEPDLKARRRADYVLNAIEDSLMAYNNTQVSDEPIMGDDQSNTWRTLGGPRAKGSVQLLEIVDTEQFRAKVGVHGVTMYGAVIATCKVVRKTV